MESELYCCYSLNLRNYLNPDEKDFSIASTGCTKSWKKVKNELDKCICVCANCHRKIHNNVIILNEQEELAM